MASDDGQSIAGITVSRKDLLESGVHFGHPRSQWNPKMKPFVFQRRKGVHILDLDHTIARLEEACYLVSETVREGGSVLFVGTKRQAREPVRKAAEKCDMPFLTRRWPGGFLTNWDQMSTRLAVLRAHQKGEDELRLSRMTKRERSIHKTQMSRLERVMEGAVSLHEPPSLIFVADVNHDRIAVLEAAATSVPVIGILDTNSDPDLVTVGIPGNDDAVGSITLLAGTIADAVMASRSSRAVIPQEEPEEDVPAEPTAEPATEGEEAEA